jgi:hypothetical protein
LIPDFAGAQSGLLARLFTMPGLDWGIHAEHPRDKVRWSIPSAKKAEERKCLGL